MFLRFVTLTSSIIAGLCVLVLPMWALGVPGVENQYAKSWKMGLGVLLLYPAAWMLNYLPYFVMQSRVSEPNRVRWQFISACFALVVLLVAVVRMFQAFRTMR